MRVCVVGAGHGGTAFAADLTRRGHEVTLLKSSSTLHSDHFDHLMGSKTLTISEDGASNDVELASVTTDFSDAVPNADVVVVFVQTNYQANVVARLAPYLNHSQLVLFEPGYLATAIMLAQGIPEPPMVAEATSSPLDCRIIAPGVVDVAFRNVANHVAVWPSERAEEARERLSDLGVDWIFLGSVLEAALHNPNLIVHTVGAIMSIPRIEVTRGQYWMYREVFTESVWQIVESLDGEKMAVLEHYGRPRLPYVEACKQRNAPDDERSALEVFFDYAHNHSVQGPSVVDSRYITEDVPEGLVLLESLGRRAGVATPVTSSLICIAEAALNRDFRTTGRTSSRLGESALDLLLPAEN